MLHKKLGFKMSLMTWRALTMRPYHEREARLHDSAPQGLGTLVETESKV
jgi:hypothetical protein